MAALSLKLPAPRWNSHLDSRPVRRAAPARGMHVVASAGKAGEPAKRLAATIALSYTLSLSSTSQAMEVYQLADAVDAPIEAPAPTSPEAPAAPAAPVDEEPPAPPAKPKPEDLKAELEALRVEQADMVKKISELKGAIESTEAQTAKLRQKLASAVADYELLTLRSELATTQQAEVDTRAKIADKAAELKIAEAEAKAAAEAAAKAAAEAKAKAEAEAKAAAKAELEAKQAAERAEREAKQAAAKAELEAKMAQQRAEQEAAVAAAKEAAEAMAAKGFSVQDNPFAFGVAGPLLLGALALVGAETEKQHKKTEEKTEGEDASPFPNPASPVTSSGETARKSPPLPRGAPPRVSPTPRPSEPVTAAAASSAPSRKPIPDAAAETKVAAVSAEAASRPEYAGLSPGQIAFMERKRSGQDPAA